MFEPDETYGVEVRLFAGLGGSLGLLKPYYLMVVTETADGECTYGPMKYDSTIHPLLNPFLDPRRIYGPAGLFYGINETRLRPGINAQLGLRFNWASEPKIRAIEVGARWEYFFRPVPIMALIDNRAAFPSLYLRIILGQMKASVPS